VNGLLARVHTKLAERREAEAAANKTAFVDQGSLMGGMGAGGGMPPMDPSMMGGQGMPPGAMPPMDPSMMGGQGMPMDPSMMGGQGMPMDPSMMGGMPMDPSMMGGQGMPPGDPNQGAPPPQPGQGTGASGGESLLPAMNQGAQAAAAAGVQIKPDQNVILMQLVRMMSWLVARVGEMSGQQFDPMLMTVMPSEVAALPQQPVKAPKPPSAEGAISPPSPVEPIGAAFGGGQPKQAMTSTIEQALALAAVLAQDSR
jgi:hypothetical protein